MTPPAMVENPGQGFEGLVIEGFMIKGMVENPGQGFEGLRV